MSVRARSATLAILALLAAASLPAYAATDPALEAAPSDGWAAMAGGTTGGSTATSDQVYSVTNRLQLLSAMATGGTRPKIIKIVGTIDMSEGVPFTDKADQDRRAQVRPPSNTTLIGAGPGAGLVNGRIDIIGVSNVIVRNLKIVAPCDIAPVFDPTDGVGGSWNAAYDGIGIQGAEHIWIDHNTITDVPTTDDTLPIENGKPKQCHDGAVDITRGANYVSVTYNVFDRHDKTMLIGHSDSNTADIGRLKVTISNNVFTAITQRAPRLRFGQVHVFNNYHVGSKTAPVYAHSYSTGIGIGGQVISTANVFEISGAVDCSSVVQTLSPNAVSAFADTGSVLNGAALGSCPVSSAVSWTIPYAFTPRPTALVKTNALAKAGAGKLSTSVTGTGSIVVPPGTLLPAKGAVAVHTDTSLLLGFDAMPALGTNGMITIRRASDNVVVDQIDVSNTPSTGDTQTVIPRTNLEVDALGLGAMPDSAARARFVFYRPVTITGNAARIKLHSNKLTFNTTYLVTIDNGVFTGTINSAQFAGVAASDGWTFTTKAAPASNTDVVVDDDGSEADFRTLQGALNWIMQRCSTGSSSTFGCRTVATPKAITLKNGNYPEFAILRNVAGLTIVGESRGGVRVGDDNFESLNSGTGASTTAIGTTFSTSGRVIGHRILGGGRPVLLVEGSDLLTLRNFTLENPHQRSTLYDNQAEAVYFNTALTAAAARFVGREMNFLGQQDTVQIKGYVWLYHSLIAGNVDYIWGNVMAALIEECEVQSVFDPSSNSAGFIVQSRATLGDAGFVFLNSTLTAGPGVVAAYLARSGGTTSTTYIDNVAYINTRMDSHILPVGWCVGTGTSKTGTSAGSCGSNPPPWSGTADGASTDAAGWREFGSTDLTGASLDVSARLGLTPVTLSGSTVSVVISKQLDSTAGLTTRAEVFFKSTIATGSPGGWVPVP
jgi:pectate lyase/pectin methylesterase-like acyl-CoA thioesterase